MNKQQLANKIWQSANKMRSKIEANEYKDYILGFVFYKFICDSQVKFLKESEFSDADIQLVHEDDPDTLKFIQNKMGYFISYDNLFSTWLDKGNDFSIDDVHMALSAFSRNITHKKVFEGIFNTLETGLSKLGENAQKQTKAVRELIDLIKDIPMDGTQDYDVLGFIYEYLIGMFAANAGKKAGEFYTPHEVSLLMSEITAEHLKDRAEISIYDPTSGSGSLLINIGQSIAKHMTAENSIKYYAQELKQNTYNLTRMNLIMRGILPSNIFTRNADTLEDDWPFFDESNPVDSYQALQLDAVVSNPPYSQAWNTENKETDPRYARFGVAPKTKADFAFLLHDLYHVKPDGIMTIILPHGVLFRGGEEEKIRTQLIENNHIDAVIGLPANIFFGTGIPTVIIVLKQQRDDTDVLIIDASKGFLKDGKSNKLQASHIKKITDTVAQRKTITKYSKLVSQQDIRDEGYNLNIPRYVDSSDDAQNYDIYATMFGGIPQTEIDQLQNFWQVFPSLRAGLFSQQADTPYFDLTIAHDDNQALEASIHSNSDVQQFLQQYASSFANFSEYLETNLVKKAVTLDISQEKERIVNDIFTRLQDIALIDKYSVFQAFDDRWQPIANDLEVLQSEGIPSVIAADPVMVMKKVKGKDAEVQDGWCGRILPFDLVQQQLLSDKLADIQTQQQRSTDIASELESVIDNLDEEDKEALLNDALTAFNSKALKQLLKEKTAEHTTLAIAKQADTLITEQKALKKAITSATDALHLHTKTVIEALSDEQAQQLLQQKWVTPIATDMLTQADNLIGSLTEQLQQLSAKYAHTYTATSSQLQTAECSLADMLEQLEADTYDTQGIQALQAILRDKG